MITEILSVAQQHLVLLPTCHQWHDALMNDLTGMKFGRLTAIQKTTGTTRGQWDCVCECGNTSVVRSTELRKLTTLSCGCLLRDVQRKRHTTHGMHKTQAYSSWKNMTQRCNNPNHRDYPRWGGRGITICEKWSTFEGFWEDMGPTHVEGLSIERVENNGNYCRENCKWADRYEQHNNKRSNRFITAFGKTLTSYAWERETGVGHETIRSRIRLGWKPEDAVSQPANRQKYYNRPAPRPPTQTA